MAIYQGKTVEEAIESGLKDLGLEKGQVEITVIDAGSKGFLGINAKKAQVQIEKVKTDGERTADFLNGLFDIMNVTAKCDVTEEEEKVTIKLITDNSHALIGYRGEVLDAIQSLAGAVANKGREDYRRVVVDCEGYREKREETLIALAHKLAQKAVRTGRKVTLEPMAPYERRILHSALSENTEVKTQSEGKDPRRYVVIIPNNLRQFSDSGKSDGKRKDEKFRRTDRRERRDSAPKQPRPKTSGFGTFLGNSLKTENNEE